MDTNEYITCSENDKEESPKPKRSSKKPPKDVIEVTNHELTRKRDILASVALIDGLKSYVGENISAVEIRKMKNEKLETYFTLYQEKAGQEMTNDMMSSLAELSVKGISFAVKGIPYVVKDLPYEVNISDEEGLKNDLLNNKQLRRTIGRQAAEVTEKFGDGVSIFRVFFDIFKHLSFSPKESSTNQISVPMLAGTSEEIKC